MLKNKTGLISNFPAFRLAAIVATLLMIIPQLTGCATPEAFIDGPNFAKLAARAPETKQVLWVKASDQPETVARLFGYRSGQWMAYGDTFPVVVGKGGTIPAAKKFEGDNKTPEGLFTIVSAFTRTPRTDIQLPVVGIRKIDKWIDDPNDRDYNKWVRGDTKARSYENLWREDGLYDLFLVTSYNRAPIIPNKGSAIFIHIWGGPSVATTGCVAMAKDKLDQVASWLDPNETPTIYIGSK